ncbi:MAG: glycosyltransferase, partial [Pirellulaceae bacterium]|nr:glycosyltransferase [Pirellulaceae bacterium]
WGFSADRVHWIPNGVGAPPVEHAAASRRRLREQLQVPADRLLLGSVGRLAPIKDFGTAIAALAEMNRRGTPADLLLVGDGPERERLAEQARRHQVERQVHFLGYRRDVGDCLSACDIYVNSSLGEAMSLSILEAMALGLPVVATDVGDNARMVAGPPPCGRVVPPNQPSALAGELAGLAADKGLRDELGRNAQRRHADCFSIQSMVDGYDSLYAQVCAARESQVRR